MLPSHAATIHGTPIPEATPHIYQYMLYFLIDHTSHKNLNSVQIFPDSYISKHLKNLCPMKYKSFLILPKKVYIQEAAPQILTNLSSRHMLIFYARNRIFLLFDFPLWGLTPEYFQTALLALLQKDYFFP